MSTPLRFALALTIAATALAAQSPEKISHGSYECWANGAARLLLNFSIRSSTQYIDSDNKPGLYSYNSKTGRLSFKGGALDGVMPSGFIAVYHEPKGRPTVSFRSPRGSEAAFCEKVK
ncbi:MAG TPA: hypothetical protein VFQ91_05765 [Bryobacteraceae bacterium]|nr:hypothetical protein [Bryobacteraceae bacterium]